MQAAVPTAFSRRLSAGRFCVALRIEIQPPAAAAGWLWAVVPSGILIPFEWILGYFASPLLLAISLFWVTFRVADDSRREKLYLVWLVLGISASCESSAWSCPSFHSTDLEFISGGVPRTRGGLPIFRWLFAWQSSFAFPGPFATPPVPSVYSGPLGFPIRIVDGKQSDFRRTLPAN